MQAPGLGAGPPGITGSSGRSPPGEAPPPPPAGLGAHPPGLWQPPGFGLGAAGCPPPSVPPPPATVGQPPPGIAPGGGANAAFGHGTVGEATDVGLQKEISFTIETQVQKLIEQARLDTESKVKKELKLICDSMMVIDVALDQLLAQLDGIEPSDHVETPIDSEAAGQLLSKIEQQWGQEIRTLKQELHQTILAHNHNADLIKHHKDTIDALRERCLKLQNPAKTSEIQQQLQKLDARLKQQQKQRKLEPLFERLSALEQRVAAAAPGAPWRYPGMSPMVPPAMPVPPGILPGMMPPNMNAAAAAAAAAAASANVMTAMKGGCGKGAAGGPGGKGAASKGATGEKGSFKMPTEEEVLARLSKLSTGPEGGTMVLGEPATLASSAEPTSTAS
eukprot:TRINITY_DN660_c0_g2_i2.p1 TRINITY_DN660_c0_g2~~TRINITY_DN660_c0_g2_i2.p1  ORF type:complete len:391 (+),score=100.25 TRINITY_DN660_c0_g2_i2:82-1254(+)